MQVNAQTYLRDSGLNMFKQIAVFVVFAASQCGKVAWSNGVLPGEEILKSECSACHAIGPTGASPNPRSPPFRDVVKRYPPENLIEALAEGITTGHNEMPEFIFEPNEIMDIVDYLNTLKK